MKSFWKWLTGLFKSKPTNPNVPVEPTDPADGEPIVTPENPAPKEPKWLTWARGELGVKEVPGSGNNARVLFYHAHANNKYGKDSVAWCSSFICAALEQTGFPSTDSEWANSYANSPRLFEKLAKPIHGCIVVFKWNSEGQGHVAFLDLTAKGTLPCLGGNQSDAVNITDYGSKKSYLVGYYWPKGAPKPGETPTDPTPAPDTGTRPKPVKGWEKAYSDFLRSIFTKEMLIADKSSIVPNWKSHDQKELLVKIFQAMAYAESSLDRTTHYKETGLGKDAVTGLQNTSMGLLQVSYQDARYYGAKFDWAKDKPLYLRNNRDPDLTIYDPYKNLECGVLIFTKLLKNHGESFQGAGRRYWSVLRPGDGNDRFKKALKEIL